MGADDRPAYLEQPITSPVESWQDRWVDVTAVDALRTKRHKINKARGWLADDSQIRALLELRCNSQPARQQWESRKERERERERNNIVCVCVLLHSCLSSTWRSGSTPSFYSAALLYNSSASVQKSRAAHIISAAARRDARSLSTLLCYFFHFNYQGTLLITFLCHWPDENLIKNPSAPCMRALKTVSLDTFLLPLHKQIHSRQSFIIQSH